MTQSLLPLVQPATSHRRRGRPPGAKSKRSLDLARYIEATYAGQTPGQQAAQLCMVTPRDIREAKARAAELQIVDMGLQPLVLAMVVKAAMLGKALGVSRAEAWSALHAERKELMSYVHQKQAPAADKGGAAPIATVFMVPDGPDAGALADFTGQDEEAIEILEQSDSARD